MYIFIDESGKFIDPNKNGYAVISSVGALVVPHAGYAAVIEEVKFLKRKWNYIGELKGCKLNEIQVSEFLDVLEKYDLLFVSVMVDSKMLSKHIIDRYKRNQAEHIRGNISKHHHPNVANQIRNMSEATSEISEQLYVQYEVMTELVYKVHQLSTLYYVQRQPQELGSFEWIIDAKDRKLIPAEKLWHETLMPMIQGRSNKKPLIMLSDADYSYYCANFDSSEAPNASDIKRVFEKLRFIDSSKCEGLQLVDVVTSVITKIMNKKFPLSECYRIGRLMTHFTESFIPILNFNDESPDIIMNVSYAGIIMALQCHAKPMFI